jgi:hypothetical protein
VKNITVSVPDEVYRQARIRAAERDTSVSALVRGFLVQVGEQHEGQKGLLRETIDSVRDAHPNFSASDRLSRDQIHDRDAPRREYDSALRDNQKTVERG